jgi:hypothetical protein
MYGPSGHAGLDELTGRVVTHVDAIGRVVEEPLARAHLGERGDALEAVAPDEQLLGEDAGGGPGSQ